MTVSPPTPEELASARWFGGKAAAISRVDVEDRIELAGGAAMEVADELVAHFRREERIVELDPGRPRQGAADQIFEAGLGGGGHGDGVAVAAQAGGKPKNGDLGDGKGVASEGGHAGLRGRRWTGAFRIY